MNGEIVDQEEPLSLEFRLLFACDKLVASREDEAAIRQILDESIDWTLFAQSAIDRGRAGVVAHTLVRAAPDMVPDDILDALHKIVDQIQSRNRQVLDQVAQLIEASPVEGAVPAIQNAHAAANRALTTNPNDAAAWRDLGGVLFDLGRHKEAIACYGRALELAPEDVITWTDRARAMLVTWQLKSALAHIDKALALNPNDAIAWTLRARALWLSRRFIEAVEASDRALALDPENASAARMGIQSRLFVCDWHRREDDKRRISEGLKAGRLLISALHHRAISDSEAEQLSLARLRASGSNLTLGARA